MTSYIRTIHNTAATANIVDYVRVTGPYYSDLGIGSTLIPFIYENGVLDIANIDNFNSYTGIPLMDSDLGIYYWAAVDLYEHLVLILFGTFEIGDQHLQLHQ